MRILWFKLSLRHVIVVLIGCSILGFWAYNREKTVKLNIPNQNGNILVLEISNKDCNRLDFFFRKLVSQECFGYTLMGSKPLSFGIYIRPLVCSKYSPRPIFFENLKMIRGWKTWKKYEKQLPLSRFSIVCEKSPYVSDVNFLFLIDKIKAQQIIEAHRNDFLEILGEVPSIEDLLATNAFLSKGLKKHEYLFGMFLGYGSANSWLFHNRKFDILKPVWDEAILEIESEKREKLGESLEVSLMLPSFMADSDSEETKHLRADFTQTKQKIIDYYQGKDFLEATLSLLIGPSSD